MMLVAEEEEEEEEDFALLSITRHIEGFRKMEERLYSWNLREEGTDVVL